MSDDDGVPDWLDELKRLGAMGCPREAWAAAEIGRVRAERDKFERAWNDVSARYEALLNQLGAPDV